MSKKDEALKLALEALESDWDGCVNSPKGEAITAIREALAEQPAQQGITLDGMTANEFALAELYAFQEATGCDTADQLKAQPEPVAWGVFDGPNLHDVNFTEEEAHEMVRLKGDGSVVKPLYTSTQPRMQPCAGRNCGSTNPNLHSAECFEDYEKSTGMSQWQGLTEEEINNSYLFWVVDQQDVMGFGKSLETKLKRKNI